MAKRIPSPDALLCQHPNARGFTVSDGRVRLGYVVADDTGRNSSKRVWAFDADDAFIGEFDSRLAALAALPNTGGR